MAFMTGAFVLSGPLSYPYFLDGQGGYACEQAWERNAHTEGTPIRKERPIRNGRTIRAAAVRSVSFSGVGMLHDHAACPSDKRSKGIPLGQIYLIYPRFYSKAPFCRKQYGISMV